MKLYCICCDQIPWRKEAAIKEFATQNLDVEMFQGIHGPTFGLTARLPCFDSKPYFISPGYIGLHLSNLLLWSRCCERDDEHIVIFEDDPVLLPNFMARLNEVIEVLPRYWDICNLSPCCDEESKTTQDVNELLKVTKYPMCMNAMLYNKKALPFIIKQLSVICNSHVDIEMEKLVLPYLNQYCVKAPLAKQVVDYSVCGRGERTYKDLEGWEFDFSVIYDEALDRVQAPSVFVEIGSWFGKSASYMAEEIKRRYLPVNFYAVDTWKGSMNQPEMLEVVQKHGGDLFKKWQMNMSVTGAIDFVIPIQKDSIEAAKQFEDKSVDFVFFDSEHTYKHLLAELAVWLPKLKDTGVAAGHDLVLFPEVRKCVHAVFGNQYRTYKNSWIVETHPNKYAANTSPVRMTSRERIAKQTKAAIERRPPKRMRQNKGHYPLVLFNCIHRGTDKIGEVPCGCSTSPPIFKCNHPYLQPPKFSGECVKIIEIGAREQLIEERKLLVCQSCTLRVSAPGVPGTVEEWKLLNNSEGDNNVSRASDQTGTTEERKETAST